MITYHLVATHVWESQLGGDTYLPEAFDQDGFVHCTDGEQAVIDTANRYYQADRRPFVVLSIETDALTAAVRYEDPKGIYPHVYGPIDRAAVTQVRNMERDPGGRFRRIASPPHGPARDR